MDATQRIRRNALALDHDAGHHDGIGNAHDDCRFCQMPDDADLAPCPTCNDASWFVRNTGTAIDIYRCQRCGDWSYDPSEWCEFEANDFDPRGWRPWSEHDDTDDGTSPCLVCGAPVDADEIGHADGCALTPAVVFVVVNATGEIVDRSRSCVDAEERRHELDPDAEHTSVVAIFSTVTQ